MRVRGTDRAWAAFFAAVSNQSFAGFSGRRHVTDLRDDAVLSEASDGGGGGATASSSLKVGSTKAIVAAEPTDDRRLFSTSASSTAALMTSGDSSVAGKSSASSWGCCGHMGVACAVSLNGGNSSEGAGVRTTVRFAE